MGLIAVAPSPRATPLGLFCGVIIRTQGCALGYPRAAPLGLMIPALPRPARQAGRTAYVLPAGKDVGPPWHLPHPAF